LIDLMFTCGLVGVIAGVAIPSLHASRQRDAARHGARYLANRLHAVRFEALRRNTAVAVRFDPDEVGRFAVFADGDGDGVLQSDIDRAVDVALQRDVRLQEYFASVAFRVAADVPALDESGVIAQDSDPLRLGPSNFLSFSPTGSATGGTLYLAGLSGPQMAIRIFGATGRIRVLSFDRATRTWRDD
jgi:Tfp pilus assembly protein FimT